MENLLMREMDSYRSSREKIKEEIRAQQEAYANSVINGLGEDIKQNLSYPTTIKYENKKERLKRQFKEFKERLNNLLMS